MTASNPSLVPTYPVTEQKSSHHFHLRSMVQIRKSKEKNTHYKSLQSGKHEKKE